MGSRATVSRRYDCAEPMERTRGIAEAVSAVRRGELIVLPTDTVYGVGADAFVGPAVTALLEAKGRGRDMPRPSWSVPYGPPRPWWTTSAPTARTSSTSSGRAR